MSDLGDDDFPGGPNDVEFWSLAIPPNKTVESRVSQLPNMMEIAHVTSAALGEEARPGRHVVKIIPLTLDGKRKPEVALGTLELGRTDQFALDFGFSSSMGFRHSGPSTVFLSGYLTRSYGGAMYGSGSEDDDEDYSGGEEESSSSESEDDEEAPQAVALMQNGPAKLLSARPAARPSAAAAAAAMQAADSSDEGEDEEDSEEGESGDEDRGDVSSDDEGESDEDEDDDDEQQAAAAAQLGKRGARLLTPQPGSSKKQRGLQGQPLPAPASAPPKAAKAAATAAAGGGGADASFKAALVSELRKAGGNMSLSALGSKVKKPEGVQAKFKVFLARHPDTFSVAGDNVSLQ